MASSSPELEWLKTATYRDLLTLWRFEPNGSKWFTTPLHDPFYEAFDRERNKLTIPEMQAISKEIGFAQPVARGAYDQGRTK